MKKTALILLFSTVSIASFSQVFRIGTGIGGGSLGKSVGLNLNLIEVGIAPRPAIEAGGYFGLTANARRKLVSGQASADLRYGLQGKYYFKETGFKPYAALQAGLLNGVVGTIDALGNENGVKESTRFEVAPMVGFRAGPLNMNLTYQQGVKLNLGLLFGFGEYK
ncbi:MAG: hypothetical protein NWQ46_04230 [Spirosomaceae bacterium]|nr:hypothetical protein [Spirosomataceae bacterium]